MGDIVGLGTVNHLHGKCDDVLEVLESATRIAKEGNMTAIAIVGLINNGKVYYGKHFEGCDASAMAGEVSMLLYKMQKNQDNMQEED